MKKRSIISLIICFVMLLTLTGCGNKKAISTTKFKEVAESSNLNTVDVLEQYSNYSYIKEATVARSDNWQIEFYVLSDKTNAVSMYNTNKAIFESLKGNTSAYQETNISNYSSYSLTSNNYYMHLCRVDNTLLYVKVNVEYKNDAQNIIKKLGY